MNKSCKLKRIPLEAIQYDYFKYIFTNNYYQTTVRKTFKL